MSGSTEPKRRYRAWVRWGVALAGLALGAESARRTWGLVTLLKSLGLPDPNAPPEFNFIKALFVFNAAGTIAVLSLTIWAFFGLKKWAKNSG